MPHPSVNVTLSQFFMDVNKVTLSQWQTIYYWAIYGQGFEHFGFGLQLQLGQSAKE